MPADGAAIVKAALSSAAHVPADPWPDALLHTSEAQFAAWAGIVAVHEGTHEP